MRVGNLEGRWEVRCQKVVRLGAPQGRTGPMSGWYRSSALVPCVGVEEEWEPSGRFAEGMTPKPKETKR